MCSGAPPSRERDLLVDAFKPCELTYRFSVAVLTTGFAAPHVDLIALLRPTESVSLYQQIVGRGLRLSPGKADCLILDYAGNPWDLYAPEVGIPRPDSDAEPVQVECPACGHANLFWGKRDGDLVIEHFGRRCQGLVDSARSRAKSESGFLPATGKGQQGAASGAYKEQGRSEERRVGKECGGRGAASH